MNVFQDWMKLKAHPHSMIMDLEVTRFFFSFRFSFQNRFPLPGFSGWATLNSSCTMAGPFIGMGPVAHGWLKVCSTSTWNPGSGPTHHPTAAAATSSAPASRVWWWTPSIRGPRSKILVSSLKWHFVLIGVLQLRVWFTENDEKYMRNALRFNAVK